MQSYYNILDCIPCAVLCIPDYFIILVAGNIIPQPSFSKIIWVL